MEYAASDIEREGEWVRAAQRGEREAFARLYEENASRVYGYLRSRVPQPADAEDITANVFIKAMQSLPSYRHRGIPFSAWLMRIAHNEMANFFKRQSRRREVPLEGQERSSSSRDPSEVAITQVEASEVRQVMGEELTDLQQQVIRFRFGAELSIAETAQAMNRSEGAIKFLQHSAVRALRRKLQPGESHG